MYKALSNMRHNGVNYNKGEVLPDVFSESEVADLLKNEIIEVVNEVKVEAKVDTNKKESKGKKGKDEKKVKSDEPSLSWGKTKLVGYARGLGLTIDASTPVGEVLKMIKNAPPAPPAPEIPVPTVTINDNPTPQPTAEEIIEKQKAAGVEVKTVVVDADKK